MNITFERSVPDEPFEYVADWRLHPTVGTLPLGWRMTRNTRVYGYDDPAPLRLLDNFPTLVSCCQPGGFNYDIHEGDSVLLADNAEDGYPLHVKFDQPVSAFGTQVSADAAADRDYERRVAVRLSGENTWREAFVHVAALTSVKGTAPFLTVRAINGARIAEVGFDVTNLPGSVGNILQVAIGPLYFSP